MSLTVRRLEQSQDLFVLKVQVDVIDTRSCGQAWYGDRSVIDSNLLGCGFDKKIRVFFTNTVTHLMVS